MALAQKLGFRQGTISRVERGQDIRVGTLIEIARALDFELTLVPRRLRSAVDMIVDNTGMHGESTIYTGGGETPYQETMNVMSAITDPDQGPVRRRRGVNAGAPDSSAINE